MVTILLGSVALFLQTGSKTIMVFGGISILVGMMMCIMALVASTKPKSELMQDERVTRINEKAGYYAGLMIMSAVIILFQANNFWSLGVELKDMYYTVLLVGVFSWLVFRWYFQRKVI